MYASSWNSIFEWMFICFFCVLQNILSTLFMYVWKATNVLSLVLSPIDGDQIHMNWGKDDYVYKLIIYRLWK